MNINPVFPVLFDCTFENGVCGMERVPTVGYRWIIDSGGTGSPGTGPSQGDSQSQFYVYAEASNRQPGDVAR